jgi:hypothetical protein
MGAEHCCILRPRQNECKQTADGSAAGFWAAAILAALAFFLYAANQRRAE